MEVPFWVIPDSGTVVFLFEEVSAVPRYIAYDPVYSGERKSHGKSICEDSALW